VERYSYSAYGETTIFDSAGNPLGESAYGNRYLFQGREYDSSAGFYYFRARWYSPETGRWLSKDPIGISGGLNLYVFCGNNPVNLTDPFGLYDQMNRELGGSGARSPNNPITHSFVSANGKTYGWGSEKDKDGNGVWSDEIRNDSEAAKEAYKNGKYQRKDPSLDPFLDQAMENLKNSPGSKHKNWWFFMNCKSELKKLIREAKRLQSEAEEKKNEKR
jgi:RHS repeat-associated protein